MKTQISKQHINVVAVQPQTTFHKEDRMKKQSFNTLRLAILFAMVLTMALSAVAQVCVPGSTYCNPLQVALKAWYPANQAINFSSFYDSAGTAHTLSSPNDMAFDGSNLWISNPGNNTVMKVRAADGQFQASYPMTSPGSLAFDGQRIWVNQRGGTTVSAIYASDGRPALSPITIASNPKGLAWDGWTMWEVTDTTVGRINSWGGGYYCLVTTPGGNTGVAFDGNYTWVSNASGNGYVYKYDWHCTLQPGYPISVLGRPAGIVFDGTNMWTANGSNGTVARITPGGTVSNSYPVGNSPQQVVFDGGNIWVTLGSGGRVAKVFAFGGYRGTVSAIIAPCSSAPVPVGLAFDGASVWTSCPTSNAVGKM
ncbi:MAG TPA: hypothetical protein VII95_10955 [Terriglobales bacterium]|jgi:hypothetical protein